MNVFAVVPNKPGFYVICVDGFVRHRVAGELRPFATLGEADWFAEHGHACHANHTIIRVLEIP